jgi:adhesin transport system outer membrane protein
MLFLCFGNAISLEDVIRENLSQNPQIRMSIANYKASYYELERVKAEAKPTLYLSGEIGRERVDIEYSVDGSHQLTEQQLALVGKYNLFEGYKQEHKVSEKKSALAVAKNQLFQKVNKISFSIVQVYLHVLWKKALLEIEEESYQNHHETLEKVKIRLEAGDGYESDYRQTKARLKLAEINYLLAKKVYRHSQINYKRFIHQLPDLSTMYTPLISLNFKGLSIQDFIDKAYRDNFTLKAQKSQLNVSKSLYEQEKSQHYPTLDLELSQAWNNNLHGFKGADNSQKIALVFSYNLYNGGADEVSQLSALKRSEIESGSLDNIKLLVEEEITVSLMKYQVLEEQLTLTEEQLEHLSGTKELYELEYQHSKRTVIDLLNIKQEYTHAQSQKVNALFERLLTYYQFKSVIGELITEFGLDNIIKELK